MMQQALEIFANGIGGVFVGMGMLYLTIKLLALTPDKKPEENKD